MEEQLLLMDGRRPMAFFEGDLPELPLHMYPLRHPIVRRCHLRILSPKNDPCIQPLYPLPSFAGPFPLPSKDNKMKTLSKRAAKVTTPLPPLYITPLSPLDLSIYSPPRVPLLFLPYHCNAAEVTTCHTISICRYVKHDDMNRSHMHTPYARCQALTPSYLFPSFPSLPFLPFFACYQALKTGPIPWGKRQWAGVLDLAHHLHVTVAGNNKAQSNLTAPSQISQLSLTALLSLTSLCRQKRTTRTDQSGCGC